MSDSNFKSGAVRSSDTSHLDFTALPLVGLIGVARTASEGATKYGRLNYMQGMPVHDTLNHSIRHVVMYLLGDRSEPHLEHAAWGLLASIQQETLDPSVSKPHLLGPGAIITPDVQAHLDANKEDLVARRKSGEFAGIGEWNLRDLPEIKTILGYRSEIEFDACDLASQIEEGLLAPVNAQGQAIANNEEPREPIVAMEDPRCLGRFRVPGSHESAGRIVFGEIYIDSRPNPDQSHYWDCVLVNSDEPMANLESYHEHYRGKRLLVVSHYDWVNGKPYSIDSDWGYASASAKSSKITGEVTRTELINGGQGPAGDPLPDEAYVDFIIEGVRVYFKKS